jgi:hypothetical protein
VSRLHSSTPFPNPSCSQEFWEEHSRKKLWLKELGKCKTQDAESKWAEEREQVVWGSWAMNIPTGKSLLHLIH